jgi:hypothetical protein
MAATVSGSKTINNAVAPHLSASTLTNLMATAVENLTVAQLRQLEDAVSRISFGTDPNTTLGQLLQ